MSTYFFIGAHAMIWDSPYKFERFGQLAEMDDEFAAARCLDGLQIIPATDPAAKAFTADELKLFPARHHPKATPEFAAKVAAADAALEKFRESLREAIQEVKEPVDANAE
jgi:hypothetical protein